MVVNTSELSNPQQALNKLGGSQKIIEIITTFNAQANKEGLIKTCGDILIEEAQGHSSKFIYGISSYSFSQSSDQVLKKFLISIKKRMQSEGLKSRFINKNFKNLESAAIKGEKLLEKGMELVMILGKNNIFIGKTVALQDFEAYSHRDYDRPGRDARQGMLPPKLAQIMINLTGLTDLHTTPNSKTIYDPFCGIGTVLTEGLLMNLSVVGSDINNEAVLKAKENIDFILKQNSTTATSRVFTKDTTMLTPSDVPENLAAIVTESFLGPPLSQFPLPPKLRTIQNEIIMLTVKSLKALSGVIKKGTPIVMTLPVWRDGNRLHYMEHILDEIRNLGYQLEPIIPQEFAFSYQLPTSARGSLVYDRPDQIVGREVLKLRKK